MLVNNAEAIYVGQTEIEKVYAGQTIVYEKSSPTPYTPLEYIESSGINQYINSDYVFSGNTAKIQIKFYHYSTGGNNAVFGSYVSNPYYKTAATIHGGNYYFSNKNPSGITYSKDTIHDVELEVTHGTDDNKNGTFSIYENGQLLGSGNGVGAFPSGNNGIIYLFTQFGNGVRENIGAHSRIYYMKMWDDNVLVRDFIPVLDENNVPCMYDKVTREYFYNGGTGTFNYA